MKTSKKANNALDYLIFRMQNQGYAWAAPNSEVGKGDAEVLKKMRCPLCVGVLMYVPFTKAESYRPFSVCSQCGKVSEF